MACGLGTRRALDFRRRRGGRLDAAVAETTISKPPIWDVWIADGKADWGNMLVSTVHCERIDNGRPQLGGWNSFINVRVYAHSDVLLCAVKAVHNDNTSRHFDSESFALLRAYIRMDLLHIT